jgi:hypothetical protein
MRTATAYFAGVGTVVAAVAVGLGGGLLISNIVSPHEPRTEMSKLELRMSSKPIPATNNTSEPVPQPEATQTAPPAETVAANPPPPSDTTAAIQAAQPASPEPAAAPENAFAKARDADVKRVTEKRRAERRQQWTERRLHHQDQELRDVEEKVRQETQPRQAFTVEPVRLEMPRIRLFDPE